MRHECARCGKVYDSVKGFDQHSRHCKKRPRPVPPPATTDAGPSEHSNRFKRVRIAPPEEGHVGLDDLDDLNTAGLDIGPHEDETPASAEPPSPPPVRSVRSGRLIRLPRYLVDYVPHGDMSLAHVPPRAPTPPERDDRTASPVATPPPDSRAHSFQTLPNKLGVFRRYTHNPTWYPRDEENLHFVCDFPTLDTPPPPITTDAIHEVSFDPPEPSSPFAPFSSYSTASFMAAYFSGSDTKSEEHANAVAKTMEDSRFDLKDLHGFSAQRENKRLDNHLLSGAHPFRAQDGWLDTTLDIRLPVEGVSFESEADAHTLPIPNLFHRRITDIVRSVCASEKARSFHFSPYTMRWTPDLENPDKSERIYGETYSADAMIQAQVDVNNLPRPHGDTTERVALGLMLASDSSQLTNFGSASVWPIYLMFANQSKQERTKPSYHAVHHLAYVPSIGANFASRYKDKTEKSPKPEVKVHCKRELMHAVWSHLMDEEFVKGCTEGLKIRCADGVNRTFFIRLLTYSADYPEKVLLATIKYLGRNPCPRCLVKKEDIGGVGTPTDTVNRNRHRTDNETRRQNVERARKHIFSNGLGVKSGTVEKILKTHSIVPTRNAFSDKMRLVGQDYHQLFVVDLLHEFEIGIWKSVFTHLIRILHASPGGESLVEELDRRFESMPTFGIDTVRSLPGNISDMSKLAARDYEDVLQCSIPAFEGLFPHDEDNKIIGNLLFLLATWHAYAKLRLHTDSTLEKLEAVGTSLCQVLRKFANVTCPRYATSELPREATARRARPQTQATQGGRPASSAVKQKRFNMCTYKTHCIPDYAEAIRRYGTTDSYNTQISELTHILSKIWFRMSNKNRGFIRQITIKEMRARHYRTMRERLAQGQSTPTPDARNVRQDLTSNPYPPTAPASEDVSLNDPGERYRIAKTHASSYNLGQWLYQNRDDPALRDFRRRLLDHLLARIWKIPYTGDEHEFTDADRDMLIIEQNRLYEHKTIRFRSTTYDARRMEETANPSSHADVIVLAHEDGSEAVPAFPYWHARIIGIYHVMVRQKIPGGTMLSDVTRMDFLFVRWFGLDSIGGWRAQRMHSVGFLPDTGTLGPAFGFLDPVEVIRMVHLIPDFVSGRTQDLLSGPSVAIQTPHEDGEYKQYYVGMFSDRDLFMRYRGGGVGHLGTRHCNKVLLADEHAPPDPSDIEPSAELVEDQESDHEGWQGEDEGNGSGGEDGAADDGVGGEDNNDELIVAASNDSDIVTAAGFAVL